MAFGPAITDGIPAKGMGGGRDRADPELRV